MLIFDSLAYMKKTFKNMGTLGLHFVSRTGFITFALSTALIATFVFIIFSYLLSERISFVALLLSLGFALVLTIFFLLSANTFLVSSFRKELDLFWSVLESSSEPMLITDANGRIEYVNPAFCSVTGYLSEEVIGKNPSIMKSGRHDAAFYTEMWKSIQETGQWEGEIWDKRKSGEIYPKWLSINTVRHHDNTVWKYVGIFSDLTSLKQTEQHLEYLAHYDSLTNIPNRLLFRDRLQQAMKRADRSRSKVALLFFDLNRFKHVNDTFGHFAGDQLLIEFANRVGGCIRDEDTLARIGGDEFAIVLDDIKSRIDVENVIGKIMDTLTPQFLIKGHILYVTTSIGVALYPTDGNRSDILFTNADMAMYVAKEMGGNSFFFFEPSLINISFEHLSTETNLRQAIANEEFVLHYQPQVDLKTGAITGMESLIRRKQGEWLVPPAKFIYLAEETGLIVPISEWVLKSACRQNKQWINDGLPHMCMGVNFTAAQLFSVKLLNLVEEVLKDTGLDPGLLELELTERVIVKDPGSAIQLMRDLKSLGIHLSIDDFGTGYSSLSYLNRFPVDKLKIDISFVKECHRDPHSASITRAIINLAHNLGMKVIAEGVETKGQLDFLTEHGCDEIQGFYFSIPLSPDGLKSLIKSEKLLKDVKSA